METVFVSADCRNCFDCRRRFASVVWPGRSVYLATHNPLSALLGLGTAIPGLFLCGLSQRFIHPSARLKYYGACMTKGGIRGMVICTFLPLIAHLIQVPDKQYISDEIFPGILKMLCYGPATAVAGGVPGIVCALLYARLKSKTIRKNGYRT